MSHKVEEARFHPQFGLVLNWGFSHARGDPTPDTHSHRHPPVESRCWNLIRAASACRQGCRGAGRRSLPWRLEPQECRATWARCVHVIHCEEQASGVRRLRGRLLQVQQETNTQPGTSSSPQLVFDSTRLAPGLGGAQAPRQGPRRKKKNSDAAFCLYSVSVAVGAEEGRDGGRSKIVLRKVCGNDYISH